MDKSCCASTPALDTMYGPDVVGWVERPSGRGTLDIVFANFLTLFVCVWSVLHHNLQARGDGNWAVFVRKCRWAALTVCAPEMPTLTREDIWRRSKADHLAKGLAFIQAGWVLLQAIARTHQGLAITPLEVFTAAFVIPILATQFFWSGKPQNVAQPATISVDWTVAELLVSAGDAAAEPCTDTRLDFVEKSV